MLKMFKEILSKAQGAR